MIQIKLRRNGSIIYEVEAKTIKEAVQLALQDGINLDEADPSEANTTDK